jgi:hypothetical protein
MCEGSMSTLLIELKDDKKKSFIRDLLANYDFVEIIDISEAHKSGSNSLRLLELSNLWENYDIDIDILREKAWSRNFDIDRY